MISKQRTEVYTGDGIWFKMFNRLIINKSSFTPPFINLHFSRQ